MIDFIKSVKTVLEEQGKSLKELFDKNIIPEDTFYKYRQRFPSLKTLIKIVNHLEVSIDYLFELSDENQFSFYEADNLYFYENVTCLIKAKNLSNRQFCSDLNFSKDNVIRWKKGTLPSIQTLLVVAEYFGCTVDELIKPTN